MFFPQDTEKYLPVLESNDFDINANYCVIAVMVETNNNCYVLNDFTEAETEQFVNGVQNLQNSDRTLEMICLYLGDS